MVGHKIGKVRDEEVEALSRHSGEHEVNVEVVKCNWEEGKEEGGSWSRVGQEVPFEGNVGHGRQVSNLRRTLVRKGEMVVVL